MGKMRRLLAWLSRQQSRGNMGLIVTQGIWFSFTIEARQNELVAGVVQSLEYQMESYSVV